MCRVSVCQHPRREEQRGFVRVAREAKEREQRPNAPEVLLGVWRTLRLLLLLLGQYGSIICEGLIYLPDCRVDSISCAGLQLGERLLPLFHSAVVVVLLLLLSGWPAPAEHDCFKIRCREQAFARVGLQLLRSFSLPCLLPNDTACLSTYGAYLLYLYWAAFRSPRFDL